MSKNLEVDFDPKRLRFIMKGGFHLLDILRSFPSRRFDPKSKTWNAPLIKHNLTHLRSLIDKGLVSSITDTALGAMADFDKLTAGPAYVPFPSEHEFVFQPYEHQLAMLNKAWGLKGIAFFAEMGTGKTFATINLAIARFKAGQIDRLIIICPETLRRTWEREFKKYAPADSFDFRFHATNDGQMPIWAQKKFPKLKVLAVSVEGLGISATMFDSVIPFFRGPAMGVVDESSRIKNPRTLRTERTITIGSLCAYRTVLNGTPIAKGIQDLWSQFEFVDPNIIGMGDYWAFKTRYLVMGGFEQRQIVGYANVEELMKAIQPFSINVRKRDVLKNLPPKVPKTIFVDPSPEQRILLRKIATGIGLEDGFISVKNVLERMLRMQQVIGGFEPMTDIETGVTTTRPIANPKMDALLSFIEDHREGSKFIIWARYIPEIELIVGRLREIYGHDSVLTYYGETPKEERAQAEDRYCNDSTARFLVGNPSAAGLGLTLISGENDVMFYYSGTFAYIDRAQSEDRAHRIGQNNSVVVVDCVMRDTIDETIIESIAAKKDMDEFVKDKVAEGKSVNELLYST